MRTTLVIPDTVYERVRRQATEQGRNISELVTEAVVCRLAETEDARCADRPAFRFTAYAMGEPQVDITDRDALARAMED